MGYLAIDEQSKRTGFHMLKTCNVLFSVLTLLIAAMAEWLRRLTRNQMGSSRVGSNPTRSGP